MGVIQYMNKMRGVGYISTNQTLQDVFIHIKDTKDRIQVGDKVQFDVERIGKDLWA